MRLDRNSARVRYGFAVVSVGLAIAGRRLLDPLLGAQFPFALILFAILWTAWLGGFRPALASVILGGLGADYFLLEPRGSLAMNRVQFVGFLLYLFTGLGIAWLGGRMKAEKKRAEQSNENLEAHIRERTAELAASEARLAGIVSSALDAIISVDSAQRVVLFNAAAEKLFRCPAAAALGQSLDRFIPERFQAAHRRHIEDYGAGTGATLPADNFRALTGRRVDGGEFPIEASISQIEVAGKKIFTVILRDRTEREQADEAAALLAAIVDSSFDAIVGKDLHGVVTSWNAGAEKIFGYAAGEMVGQSITRIIPAGRLDDEEKILSRIRRGETVEHFETVRARKDGRLIEVSVTVSPIKNGRGEIVGASKVARDITGQKQAERALQEREAEFRILTEAMPQIVWATNAAGGNIYFNQRWTEYTGLTMAESRGDGWTKPFHPEDQSRAWAAWQKAVAGAGDYSLECRLRRADGVYRWWWILGAPLQAADGSILKWFGTCTDITERKEAEAAVRASEERFRTMANSIPQLAWIAQADGSITWYNQRWYEYTGTTLDQMAGWGWQSVHDPAALPQVMTQWQAAIATGNAFEMEFPLRGVDGRFRSFLTRVHPLKDAAGRVVQWFGTNTDVEVMKQAEEKIRLLNTELEERVARRTAALEAANLELERSRAVFVNLFESLPGLYLVLTPEFQIVTVSDAYLKATMTTREGILGRGLFEVFPDNPNELGATGVSNLRASLDRVLRHGAADTMAIQKYDVRRPDGVFEEHYWSPINSPVFGPNRQILYIVHRVEEVTEFVKHKAKGSPAADGAETFNARVQQMEAEIFLSSQKLQAANHKLEAANQELEAYSYSISHDLRAPLRAMGGFARILEEELAERLTPEARHAIDRICHNATKMGELIDGLLDFSSLNWRPVTKKPLQPADIAREVFDELQPEAAGRRVELKLARLPRCAADPTLLKQVFANLLSNALKYSQGREPARVEVGCMPDGLETAYFVRDNGAGFDMAYADKLFGVFQRLHRAEEFPGTGVGLAIVQRIVQRHGGRVWAEGKVGEGATFYFTLGEELPPARKNKSGNSSDKADITKETLA